jgi:hypothetical protein
VGLIAQSIDLTQAPDIGWLLAGGHPVVWLPLAMVATFIGALAICLPSFYFYTQLAGMDASFRLITAQALRVQARTSVLMLGVLPFYVAAGLAGQLAAPMSPDQILGLGLAMPFFLGLLGLDALRDSFERLGAVLPNTRADGTAFLRHAVVAWGAVFAAVAPIGLYRVGRALSVLV